MGLKAHAKAALIQKQRELWVGGQDSATRAASCLLQTRPQPHRRTNIANELQSQTAGSTKKVSTVVINVSNSRPSPPAVSPACSAVLWGYF